MLPRGSLHGNLVLFARVGSGSAEDWAFSPSFSVSEIYDSNINFQFSDPQSDFITSIELVFLFPLPEQDRRNLESTVNGMIDIKNNQLDRVETFNSEAPSLLLSAGYRRTESEHFVSTLEYIPSNQFAGLDCHVSFLSKHHAGG